MIALSSYRYQVVDVFTERPLEGNPLAVFPDALGIDDLTMQKIAKELNLSETAFVFPATLSGCVVNVRIFTPTREMTFAGHPTIGTSFVLLTEGIVPKGIDRFAVQEKVGPVSIRIQAGERPLIWLATPSITYGQLFDRELSAAALGLTLDDLLNVPPQVVSAGNATIFIAVKDKRRVDRAWPEANRMKLLRGAEPICVFVFAPTPEGAYSRMFAPEFGVPEDPATGSSTGPLAAFMLQHDLVNCAAGTRFVSEQGVKMGRRSILHVLINGERGVDGIDVGGYVTPIAKATMNF